MPFDPAGFRPPNVTVLPPVLRELGHDVRLPPVVPERRGGEPPRRVHIVIEIVDRRQPQRRPSPIGTVLLWLFVLSAALALFGCTTAHAQDTLRVPTEWRSYPFGSGTNSYGTDRQGREWTGRSFDVGSHTVTVITDPNGSERRCESYKLGGETITQLDQQLVGDVRRIVCVGLVVVQPVR
jgi:hypothetical protein